MDRILTLITTREGGIRKISGILERTLRDRKKKRKDKKKTEDKTKES